MADDHSVDHDQEPGGETLVVESLEEYERIFGRRICAHDEPDQTDLAVAARILADRIPAEWDEERRRVALEILSALAFDVRHPTALQSPSVTGPGSLPPPPQP